MRLTSFSKRGSLLIQIIGKRRSAQSFLEILKRPIVITQAGVNHGR
jgi:hypothetical protein